jgi:hypothetical protein
MEQHNEKGVYRLDSSSIILPFAEGESWGSRKLSTESHFDSDADLQRSEALLEMADLVVHHHSLPELFVAIGWTTAPGRGSGCSQLFSLRSHKKCDAPPLLGGNGACPQGGGSAS